jgi:hypothetical protein
MEYRQVLHLQLLFRLAALLRGQVQSDQYRLDMCFVMAQMAHLICVTGLLLEQAHRIQLVVMAALRHL